MDCKSCNKLISRVVSSTPKREPYKYKCAKKKFTNIPSSNKLGKSYRENEYEYYTPSQLDLFIERNRKKPCFARYDITNDNFLSGLALIASFLSVMISLNNTKVQIIEEKIRMDSISFNIKMKVLENSLNRKILNLKRSIDLTNKHYRPKVNDKIKK